MKKKLAYIESLAASKAGHAILHTIRILLIGLWTYTSAVKLGNMPYNIDSMHKQFFPAPIATLLAYFVPVLAIISLVFLVFNLKTGLLLSIAYLTAIILFIVVVLSEIIAKETCSCAGIFKEMNYKGHLVFSLIMWTLTVIALYIYQKNKAGMPKTATRVGS
jgi:uncharacterized membrane protein YphA (DoxX/SURF4 family)